MRQCDSSGDLPTKKISVCEFINPGECGTLDIGAPLLNIQDYLYANACCCEDHFCNGPMPPPDFKYPTPPPPTTAKPKKTKPPKKEDDDDDEKKKSSGHRLSYNSMIIFCTFTLALRIIIVDLFYQSG